MDNLYLYILSGVIVVLFIIILALIFTRHKGQKPKESNTLDRIEERRRKKASDKINEDINKEFEKQKQKLKWLKERLRSEYENVGKTYVCFGNLTFQSLHNELTRLFGLNRDEFILYCRRYEKVFGSDSFFIITENGIGYAPNREVLPICDFDEIKEFNIIYGNVEVVFKDGETGWIDLDHFTYNGSSEELTRTLNNFLNGYKSAFDIYFDACSNALEEKATPILPTLIEKVGETSKNWANFFRAYYKCILCEDGIDIKDNSREAIYDIENILNLAGEEDKDTDIFNACLVLKARVKLVNGEDHIEIKKLLDTVLGNNCEQYVIDEANKIRRRLEL